jgi:AcrR family transcriptional regulator
MPKIVDHDQRRHEFVLAAWRLIVHGGFEAATMAAIADEAGYANGAIKPYFATKHDLLHAIFDHIYEQTTQRATLAISGLHGVDALRAYCCEIMPLSTATLEEARVIIPFWHHALTDRALIERHDVALTTWRTDLTHLLADARRAGAIGSRIGNRRLAELILTTLHGSQITALLTTTTTSPLAQQLDDLLALITTPRKTRNPNPE